MTFDDRLATVLSLDASHPHDRAVRWRQLVDLVSRIDPDAQSANLTIALAAIRAGQDDVPVALRAAAARAIAGQVLPPALLEIFAADTIDVAAPLLAQAPDEAVRAAASPDVARFLDALYTPPGRSTAVTREAVSPPDAAPLPPLHDSVPSIGEVVARIEQLRTSRAARDEAGDGVAVAESPALPLPIPKSPPKASPPEPAPVTRTETPASESPALFRWECGPGGEIDWVEGIARGKMIGRSIARTDGGEGVDRGAERAFARRAPFRDAALALPEGGRWLISGVPAFARDDGRFAGYRGIARRAEALSPPAMAVPRAPVDPATLRELVHEIKTPLNAIIGFAEIIDGQYLGPAQSGYRQRAAEIVDQAQLLLAAIHDLDLAARLRGGGERAEELGDASAVLGAVAQRMQKRASEAGVSVAVDIPDGLGTMMFEATLADRLAERFAEAVLAAAADGETLLLSARREDGQVALRLSRPRALEGLEADALFADEAAGLSLRLAAGLAQLVGCRIEVEPRDLLLRMPVGPEGFEPPT